jgi:hypothetical protein
MNSTTLSQADAEPAVSVRCRTDVVAGARQGKGFHEARARASGLITDDIDAVPAIFPAKKIRKNANQSASLL